MTNFFSKITNSYRAYLAIQAGKAAIKAAIALREVYQAAQAAPFAKDNITAAAKACKNLENAYRAFAATHEPVNVNALNAATRKQLDDVISYRAYLAIQAGKAAIKAAIALREVHQAAQAAPFAKDNITAAAKACKNLENAYRAFAAIREPVNVNALNAATRKQLDDVIAEGKAEGKAAEDAVAALEAVKAYEAIKAGKAFVEQCMTVYRVYEFARTGSHDYLFGDQITDTARIVLVDWDTAHRVRELLRSKSGHLLIDQISRDTAEAGNAAKAFVEMCRLLSDKDLNAATRKQLTDVIIEASEAHDVANDVVRAMYKYTSGATDAAVRAMCPRGLFESLVQYRYGIRVGIFGQGAGPEHQTSAYL